ncbi:MAG: LysM peptidoglycan-binding domain-containing protein [Treponema sp.]|nr:LysM peptidoglycan-binding domain-containing protein [Treponema sp.]
MRMSDKKYLIALFTILIIHFAVFADSVHKVEKGDTLYSISRKYQITVAELRAANNLSENDVIKIGQKLIIPTADITTAVALAADNSQKKDNDKPSTSSTTTSTTTASTSSSADSVYVVEKGDTLYGIARKNNITVAELMNLNNLNSSDVIKVGQKLKIKAVTTISSSTNNSNSTSSTSTSSTSSTSSSSTSTSDTPDTRNYGVTVAADSSIVWPVVNPKITTVKGKASGVQLSAQTNEPVKCIHEGTVMYVGVYRGYGQLVFVQSKTGIIYSYAGLGSVKVRKGDYVTSGKEIATAGVDPRTKKPQITFMVFQNGQPLDPVKAPRN